MGNRVEDKKFLNRSKLFCWLVIVMLTVTFFPGLWSQDVLDSLAQALDLRALDDSHPIYLALLIRITTWGSTSFYFIFQMSFIGFCLIESLSLTFRYFGWKEKSLLFISCFLFLLLFPPGLSLPVTIAKDAPFSYGALLFAIGLLTTSKDKNAPFPLMPLIIGLLATALRHNGWVLFSGTVFFYFLLRFYKERFSRTGPLVLFCFFSFLISYSPKWLLPPERTFAGKIPVTSWTIKADYLGAYVNNLLPESEIKSLNRVIDVEKIIVFPQDTYVFTWPDLPLKSGYTELDFVQYAKEFLSKNKRIWLRSKIEYGKQLLLGPPIHSIIFGSDYLGLRSQKELEDMGARNFSIKLSRLGIHTVPEIAPWLGIMSYEMTPVMQKYMAYFWKYSNWEVAYLFCLILMAALNWVTSAEEMQKKLSFIACLSVVYAFNWLPYWILSFTNQARYYYLLYILSKYAIIVTLVTLGSIINNHSKVRRIPLVVL